MFAGLLAGRIDQYYNNKSAVKWFLFQWNDINRLLDSHFFYPASASGAIKVGLLV